MTASDTPPPLTDEEVERYRELIDLHRQYGPALSIEGEARLVAEVERLRSMKCAACGKRIGYLNYKGHLLGWGCADDDECEQGKPHRVDTERGEVLVEDSWFKVDDLPDILGNFMRASADHGREAKQYAMEVQRLRAELAEARRVADCNNVAFQKSVDELTAVNTALRADSMPRAEVAKAMDALTRAGGEAITERDAARMERDALAAKVAAVEKVIEPSDWKPLTERHPEWFEPDSPEEAARKKGWKQGVDLLTQQLRAALGETGGTE
jgi:hypothetical protein